MSFSPLMSASEEPRRKLAANQVFMLLGEPANLPRAVNGWSGFFPVTSTDSPRIVAVARKVDAVAEASA